MASTAKKAVVGVSVVLALAMFGSCVDDDDVPIRDRTEWTGTVVAHDRYSEAFIIDLDGARQTVRLAHIAAVRCGEAYSTGQDVLKRRIAQLVPVGSAVRVARTVSSGGYLSGDGFVFVEQRDAETPNTSSGSPKATTVATSPTNGPSGTDNSVNLALMAEGLATLDPKVDLSSLATTPADEAIASILTANAVGPAATNLPKLVDAYRAAWDNRIGLQAACRADDDATVVEARQQRKLDRLRAGPDGQLYTADDDDTDYRYDENGNLYVQEPGYSGDSSSGGGGDGEGRFCRRRWWC